MATRGRSGGRLGGVASVVTVTTALTLVLVACSTDAEVTAVPRPATTTVSPATTAPGGSPSFLGGPNRPPQSYDASLSLAVDDIRAFWTMTFPVLYRHPYSDLGGGVWAVYRGEQNVPGCGSSRTSFGDIAGNAFYCPEADFLAFDDSELFPQIAEQYGSEVLDLILAHEWAHAIQARAGLDQLPTIQLEQQADCFAGAWMAHVAGESSGPFPVSEQTLDDAIAGMVSFSDAPGTAATANGAHGSGFDRVSAFQDGFSAGARQCATYADHPPQVIELPLTAGDQLNGGNLPFADIVPTTVADLNRFWTKVFVARHLSYTEPAGGLQPYPTGGPYPACPGRPSDPSSLVGRVWYCASKDFIAYDADALENRVYAIGDFAVSVLLADAWSDAVQQRLGTATTGAGRSLASDCLAGAWTHSTLPDPVGDADRQLTLSAGDLDESVIAFLRFGRGEDETADVGSVFERVASFRKGFLEGTTACGIG
jgi:predicted metalloprotease